MGWWAVDGLCGMGQQKSQSWKEQGDGTPYGGQQGVGWGAKGMLCVDADTGVW